MSLRGGGGRTLPLRRVTCAVVTVAGCLLWSGSASAAQAVACTSTTAVSAPADANVMVVGDSLTVGEWCFARSAAADYHSHGLVATVDGRQARFASQGVSIVRAAGTSLPSQLVFSLGTNDVTAGLPVASYRARVETVIAIAGDDRQVFLVTLHSVRHTVVANAFNQMLESLSEQFPNVTVIDWASVIRARPGLLANDGVHLSVAGYRLRSAFIAAQVAAAKPPSLPPLVATDTAAIGAPVGFTAIDPARIADSRRSMGVTTLRAGVVQRLQVASVDGLPADATAVAATFTVTETAGPGFLTAYPCGPLPDVSSTNWPAAAWTVANSAITPLDADGGLCLRSIADTHVVVDVTGYFSATSTGRFNPVAPARAGDTRVAAIATVPVPGGQFALRFQIAGVGAVSVDATAASVNVALVDPGGPAYATVFPCDAALPATSTVNVMTGDSVQSNNAIVLLGDGAVCVFTSRPADVVVDVTGWFGPEGSLLQALAPIRLIDTRQPDPAVSAGRLGVPLRGGESALVAVTGQRGIPATAVAASLNVTAVGHRVDGFIAVYPADATWDGTSSVNTHERRPDSNGTNVALDGGGVRVLSSSGGHVIVDVTAVWV